MAASCEENDDVSVYHDLISDHMNVIIREIDIDQAMKDFPYKDAITKAEFTKLFHETDKDKQSKCFINSLLRRRKYRELKALFKIVTEGDPLHYLRTVLKDRMTKSKTTPLKNTTPENSISASVGGSSIHNDLPSVEDPQASAEPEQRSSVRHLQKEKRHLEEDLDTAQQTIQGKTDVIDCLMEEKIELKVQLQEAKTEIDSMQRELNSIENVNSDLRTQLQEAKGNIESLQNKLISHSTEMTGMHVEMNSVKNDLHSVNEKLYSVSEGLKELKSTKKSKSCSIM